MNIIKLNNNERSSFKELETIMFAVRTFYLQESNLKKLLIPKTIKDYYAIIGFTGELFDPNNPNTDGFTPDSYRRLSSLYNFVKKRRISILGDISVMELANKERIVTREKLSKKSIILGICYDEDDTYSRFMVKDLKKFYTYAFYSNSSNYIKNEKGKWDIDQAMQEIPELIDNTIKPIDFINPNSYNIKYVTKALSYIDYNVEKKPHKFIVDFLKTNNISDRNFQINNILKFVI